MPKSKANLVAVAAPATEPTDEPTDEDTLVQAWETESGIVVELHDCGDHDEVLVVDAPEDEEETAEIQPGVVTLFEPGELEELASLLAEAAKVVEARAKDRPPVEDEGDEGEDDDEDEVDT